MDIMQDMERRHGVPGPEGKKGMVSRHMRGAPPSPDHLLSLNVFTGNVTQLCRRYSGLWNSFIVLTADGRISEAVITCSCLDNHPKLSGLGDTTHTISPTVVY